MKRQLLLLLAFFSLCADPAFTQDHQHRRPDDIKQYLEHLDSTERDRYQKPSEVIEALNLKPGMAIADLGSGSGYFTRRFAKAVGETGIVYAVDVEAEMLAHVKESLAHLQVPHRVEFIVAQPDNSTLPPASVDLLFVCNTLHHLDNRARYFGQVRSALRPGGRIAIIDFYPDERSGELGFPKRHLISRDTAVTEMTAAGYRLVQEHTFLPKQYFLEFAPTH
jgi:arsenite methyltransferase